MKLDSTDKFYLVAIAIICISIIICFVGFSYANGLYQETATTTEVVSYRRAANFSIDNTYGSPPSILVTTEQITLIPGQEPITKFIRRIPLTMTDPKEIIILRNPDTGEVIGQIEAQYLYMVMYSVFRHAEDKADAPFMQGTN